MKVFIFDSTPLKQAPYIPYYEKELLAKHIPYHVCTWDKSTDAPTSIEDTVITIHSKWHLGKRKYLDFIRISQRLKKIIQEGQYTHIVVVNTIWAMLLRAMLLRDFLGRYVIDIRDYKCETMPGYQFFLKELIEKSFFTTVSSDGFRAFLPVSSKIISNHNITNMEALAECPTLFPNKEHIAIGFFGFIRYKEENETIIQCIGKSGGDRFSLLYRGVFSEGCHLDRDPALRFENVVYGGPFQNADKPEMYRSIDLIHSVYGNNDLAKSTLLPNRLYDTVIFKKPLLVSPGTYLAQVVEKYHLGVVIDYRDPAFLEKLEAYVDHFDKAEFLMGAEEFARIVDTEQKHFLDQIHAFFSV